RPLTDRVVREPTPWPERAPRRAAVSAFGFGGTNAHLVLEQFAGQRLVPRAAPRPPARLAIAGMAARVGSLASLEQLDRALYEGRSDLRPPPPERWSGVDARPALLAELGLEQAPEGAYLDAFDVDFLRAGVPPDSSDRPIPQQLLLFDVADDAIRDAGL